MENNSLHKLGIDIGSTTVKIALLDADDNILFSDYERHFANIQETLESLIRKAYDKTGDLSVCPMITGSGGLTLAKHLEVPFVQEVIAVSTALTHYAPQTDVAIELGGEDAKIIYFEGGNVEQRMNGICAGGTGSFIDQMASLIQTDATGLNEYAKSYKAIYPIAARCGVFAKTDIQGLLNEGAEKVYAELCKYYNCEYDDRGNIGKRYRRQDEIGTPYCVTFDFDSLEDGAVTVRDRDTMEQERVKIEDLKAYFAEKFAY